MINKIRGILLASMILMPIILGSIGYSMYLEFYTVQHVPVSSWIAIFVLSIYAFVKIDISKYMEEKNGTRKDPK